MMMFGAVEVDQGRDDDRTHFYDHLGGAKYMLEIADADHITFSAGIRTEYRTIADYLARDANRAAIARYAIAFMRYYLQGDSIAHDQLRMRGSAVTNYLFHE